MTTPIIAFPPARVLLDEAALCGWLAQADPGDALEYHRGFLVVDIDPGCKRLSAKQRRDLQAVARRALWAAENDLAHLVQVRIGASVFSYRMIARKYSRKAVASLSALLTKEAA